MAYLLLQEHNITPTWRWGGSVAYLYVFASQTFFETDSGEQIAQGQVNNFQSYSQKYTCTITDGVVRIPQVTLATTTDSNVPNVTYTCVLTDQNNVPRYTQLSQGFVDPSYFQVQPESSFIATLAGTVAARGVYTYRGAHNARGYYNLESFDDSVTLSCWVWTGSQWNNYGSTGTLLYHSTDDVQFPWDITTFVVDGGGTAPAPTLTEDTTLITSTWEALILSNQAVAQIPVNFWGAGPFWDVQQTKQYVDQVSNQTQLFAAENQAGATRLTVDPDVESIPIAVAENDPVWQVILSTDYLASYGCTQAGLDAAIADIGSAQAELVVTCNVSVTTNTTIPDNILVTIQGHGKFTVSGGITLNIESLRTPSGQVFFGDGNTVLAKNAVPYFDLTWWAGITGSGSDDQNAFDQARLSMVANEGGTLLIGNGEWYVDEVDIPSNCTIIGSGQYTDDTRGTVLKLVSGASDYILGCSEGVRNVSVSNLTLDQEDSITASCFKAFGDTVRSQGINLTNVTTAGESYVTVAGAGTSSVNANYTYRGITNGRPYYNKVGSATSTFVNAIYWDGSSWNISGSPTVYYGSADDVAYPYDVTTWVGLAGANPVPTVDILATQPQIKIQADTAGWECLNVNLTNVFMSIPEGGTGFYANTVNSSLYTENCRSTSALNSVTWDFDRIGFVDYVAGQHDCGSSGAAQSTLDRSITASSGLNSATVTLTSGALSLNDVGQPYNLAGNPVGNITAIAYSSPTYSFTGTDATHPAVVNQNLDLYKFVPSYGGALCLFRFGNEHATINIQGAVDEGYQNFIINNAGTYAPINLRGCFPQSQITLNQACCIVSQGNRYYSGTYNDAAATTSRIISSGDYIDKTTLFGVELVTPRLWNQHLGESHIQTEFGIEEGNQIQYVGMETRFLEGNQDHTTGPQVTIASIDDPATAPFKYNLRLGRSNPVTEQPDYYYDIGRVDEGPGTDAQGYLRIDGNQDLPFRGVKTNGNIVAPTYVGGVLTPAQITSNQNDYAPATNTSILRLATDAARNITGLFYNGFDSLSGQDGEMHFIMNVGLFNFTLVNQSASSAAKDRFLSVTGGDVVVAPNEIVAIWRDATTVRWRIAKVNITGLTSNGTTITGTLPTALTSTLAVTGAVTASSTLAVTGTTTIGGASTFKFTLTPSSGSGSFILGDTGSANYVKLNETGGLGAGLLELRGAEIEITGGSVLINGAVPLYSTNLLTKYLATTVTYNNTTTLANTALSVSVTATTKYQIELTVFSTSAVKALNMDFGGTSTQTSFIGQWYAHRDTVAGTNGTAQVTAAGTDFTVAGLDGFSSIWTFKGTMLTNGAGTFLLRGAQNVADISNSTILAGSSLILTKLS